MDTWHDIHFMVLCVHGGGGGARRHSDGWTDVGLVVVNGEHTQKQRKEGRTQEQEQEIGRERLEERQDQQD